MGGRGTSSSKNKMIKYKSSNGEPREVKINNTYLLDLKSIGLENIRGKEYNNRTEMYNYIENNFKGVNVDRRNSLININGKNYGIVTYKNKNNTIGITMLTGGSYYDEKYGHQVVKRYF